MPLVLRRVLPELELAEDGVRDEPPAAHLQRCRASDNRRHSFEKFSTTRCRQSLWLCWTPAHRCSTAAPRAPATATATTRRTFSWRVGVAGGQRGQDGGHVLQHGHVLHLQHDQVPVHRGWRLCTGTTDAPTTTSGDLCAAIGNKESVRKHAAPDVCEVYVKKGKENGVSNVETCHRAKGTEQREQRATGGAYRRACLPCGPHGKPRGRRRRPREQPSTGNGRDV